MPPASDAGLVFIGQIRTPWSSRLLTPRQGRPDGPICRIEIFEPWTAALTGVERFRATRGALLAPFVPARSGPAEPGQRRQCARHVRPSITRASEPHRDIHRRARPDRGRRNRGQRPGLRRRHAAPRPQARSHTVLTDSPAAAGRFRDECLGRCGRDPSQATGPCRGLGDPGRLADITLLRDASFRSGLPLPYVPSAIRVVGGGWGGIRTPGGRSPTPVFKTGALNHSATHPRLRRLRQLAPACVGQRGRGENSGVQRAGGLLAPVSRVGWQVAPCGPSATQTTNRPRLASFGRFTGCQCLHATITFGYEIGRAKRSAM